MINRLFSLAGAHLLLNRKCCVRRGQSVFFSGRGSRKDKSDPLVHQRPLYVFLTGRVGLLLVHGEKLVPLVLGSDPLFPQEPARGTFGVYLLHACFNHWDAHTNLTWLICPFITRVCSAFASTFIAPLGLRKDKTRRAQPKRKMPLHTCAHPERHAIDISSGFRQLSAKRPFPREARASSHSVALLSFVRSLAPLRVQSKLDCGVFYNH